MVTNNTNKKGSFPDVSLSGKCTYTFRFQGIGRDLPTAGLGLTGKGPGSVGRWPLMGADLSAGDWGSEVVADAAGTR